MVTAEVGVLAATAVGAPTVLIAKARGWTLPGESWLNEARSASGEQVLSPASVDLGFTNQLPDNLQVKMLPGVIKWLSNDGEFFPGLKKTWSYSFQYTEEPFPTGRPAGAIGWAGLANLFYWIDRDNGFGGFWATQILPFGDGPSFTGYIDFETAAYQAFTKS